jgi:hypothetical protein
MRPTWSQFQKLKNDNPNRLLIFEDQSEQYLMFGGHALIASQTLGLPLVTIAMEGAANVRGILLRDDDLGWAVSEINRQHLGIKVEIIRDDPES